MTVVVLFFFADQESLISPGNTSRASGKAYVGYSCFSDPFLKILL